MLDPPPYALNTKRLTKVLKLLFTMSNNLICVLNDIYALRAKRTNRINNSAYLITVQYTLQTHNNSEV